MKTFSLSIRARDTGDAVAAFDVLTHDSVFQVQAPRIDVFANPIADDPPSDDPIGLASRLPMRISAQCPRFDPSVICLPDVPRYPDLFRHAGQLLNWDVERFEVWRLRIAYPVVNSLVRLWFDLDATDKASALAGGH